MTAEAAGQPSQGLPETRLIASDGEANDVYGYAVAADGGRIAVGTWGDDDEATNAGAVYLYHHDGTVWQETKLTASDAQAEDHFGISVALEGDRLVVGAWGDDDEATDAGAVYVYDYDGSQWVETKLTASDGQTEDRFGVSVAVDGDRILVGAYGDDDEGDQAGAAYVYEHDGTEWQETKLTASDGEANDLYGTSVAADAGRLFVGAYGDDDKGGSAGAVYVYEHDGSQWHETKLTASDGEPNEWFSLPLAVDGDRLVTGAMRDDDNGTFSGAAYVLEYDGAQWQETKLLASDGEPNDLFGKSVAVDGSRVAVGATGHDHQGDDGTVYLYDYDGTSWHEVEVAASDGQVGDQLGYAVALDEDHLVASAPYADENGDSSGAVYVFDLGLRFFPEAGPPGLAVSLYGLGLSNATSVRFNGTPAEFTVVSDTEITAVVPYGATTGRVRVRIPILPGGDPDWLVSEEPFTVTSGEERIRGEGTYRYANKSYAFSFSAEYTTDTEPGTPGEVALAGHVRVEGRRFLFEATDLVGLQVEEGCGPCTAWLVGQGTLNGKKGYDFYLSMSDGRRDRLRLRIVDAETGEVVYDTEPKAPEEAPPTRRIASGQVVVDGGEGAGKQGEVAEEALAGEVPEAYALLRNYPNPFNPETVVPFALPEASEVSIRVYDVLGREVARLAQGAYGAGRHEVRWDAAGLPSGMYLVRMVAAGQAFTQAVTLMK